MRLCQPGELIDIGVCSPLQERDSKELSSFIVKNYIHSLKCAPWGFLGDDDNIMHDITYDASGELHESALARGLSYVRKCNKKDDHPTIHARLDPSGKVHCLFGIPYRGSWPQYAASMNHIAPLFSGKEIEVTILRGSLLGNNKRFTETKHLQVIRMFQVRTRSPF